MTQYCLLINSETSIDLRSTRRALSHAMSTRETGKMMPAWYENHFSFVGYTSYTEVRLGYFFWIINIFRWDRFTVHGRNSMAIDFIDVAHLSKLLSQQFNIRNEKNNLRWCAAWLRNE